MRMPAVDLGTFVPPNECWSFMSVPRGALVKILLSALWLRLCCWSGLRPWGQALARESDVFVYAGVWLPAGVRCEAHRSGLPVGQGLGRVLAVDDFREDPEWPEPKR